MQTIATPIQESNVALALPQVQAGVGGLVLFGSQAPGDFSQVLARTVGSAAGGIRPLVMVDEEGGAVQRIANLIGSIPSARAMAATMSAAAIGQLAYGLGQKLRSVGITMDLAPVLDVDAGAGPSLQDSDGTRSFSANPSVASADGIAFARGLQRAGVVPVVKHFPGLGGSHGNSDYASAATLSWNALQQAGLLPFAAAIRAGLPALMVANDSIPGLSTMPASLSSTVITGVLRDQLGFRGLVLTDSLSAVAVSNAGYSVPAASVLAIRSGADMILFNASDSQRGPLTTSTANAIVAAVHSGALPRAQLEASVARILVAKRVALCP